MKNYPTSLNDITNGGERVTHLYPNTCYKAHLSIYDFALRFCSGKTVLDAGSGSGYGANYLAENGAATVAGIDFSKTAVAFSQQHFRRENLHYQQMDLQKIDGFSRESFDFIFTSNVLEHVESVPSFLHTAHQLLKPDGVMLVAVPPITNAASRQANIDNPYHLNIWSPSQWHYVLSQYFGEVECYRHHIELPNYQLDFNDTAETSLPTVADFQFLPISLELLNQIGALTAMFLVRKKCSATQLPTLNRKISMVDDSFTRLPPQKQKLVPSGSNRLMKGLQLVQTNQWSLLLAEIRSFLIWQMKGGLF